MENNNLPVKVESKFPKVINKVKKQMKQIGKNCT